MGELWRISSPAAVKHGGGGVHPQDKRLTGEAADYIDFVVRTSISTTPPHQYKSIQLETLKKIMNSLKIEVYRILQHAECSSKGYLSLYEKRLN